MHAPPSVPVTVSQCPRSASLSREAVKSGLPSQLPILLFLLSVKVIAAYNFAAQEHPIFSYANQSMLSSSDDVLQCCLHPSSGPDTKRPEIALNVHTRIWSGLYTPGSNADNADYVLELSPSLVGVFEHNLTPEPPTNRPTDRPTSSPPSHQRSPIAADTPPPLSKVRDIPLRAGWLVLSTEPPRVVSAI